MRAFSIILLALLLPFAAAAQSFPTRQLRIVVPFAAGGSADVMARLTAQALNDVMAGNIQLMFENLPTVPPVLRDGRVRALALTSATRSPALPEVPRAEEDGVPGDVATAWLTIAAAAATPSPLMQRLNEDLRAVLTTPALRERFTTLGATPMGGSLEESAGFLAAETEKWTRVVDAAGIRLD